MSFTVGEEPMRTKTKSLSLISRPCHCFTTDIKPLISFGQILGLFPFTIAKGPSHSSKFSPLLLIYSMCLYVFGCYSTIGVTNFLSLISTGDEFENEVAFILFITFKLFLFSMALSCWYSGNILVKYFQMWCHFQFQCAQYIGKLPELRLRNKCVTFVFVSLMLVAGGSSTLQLVCGQIDLMFTFFSVLAGNIILLNFILFMVCCTSCKTYLQYLRRRLLSNLNCPYLSYNQLTIYRHLFDSMFQLIMCLGRSFGGPWLIMFCFFLSSFIITSFASAMGMLGNFDGTFLPFFTVSLMSLSGIIMFCYCADLVSCEVSFVSYAFHILELIAMIGVNTKGHLHLLALDFPLMYMVIDLFVFYSPGS